MKYLSWSEKKILDFSEEHVTSLYNHGFVFTRKNRGVMDQTRSVRINLREFELSSENRRILKKTDSIRHKLYDLPCTTYKWEIGKLGKNFYDTKFGPGVFSANKIKELLTHPQKNNFNCVFVFSEDAAHVGYAICYQNESLLHYSYPFYSLEYPNKNIGMRMILDAIMWAQECGKKHIYLGSAQRPTDTYKFQFAGIEWFDGKKWQIDIQSLKKILNS
jgi:leucyl-tRNA---protein transferase